MPELREVFEMVTKQTEPDLDAWREQEQRQRRTSRNRKVGALAVAAVMGIVAVIVVIRAADGGAGKQPGGQSTPTTAEPIPALTDGPLEPGRYVISTSDPGFNASHLMTIDVPDGYAGDQGFYAFSTSLPETGVSVWAVGYSFADACDWRGTRSAISSADDLVAAITGQRGLRPSVPTDVVMSGYAGTFMELTTPASAHLVRCDEGEFRVWAETGGGPRYLNNPGQHDLLWILDVDGVPLVVGAPLAASASAQDRAELLQMVDSIQIDPR